MAKKHMIVVGAGPAGVRATEALVAAGLRPILIDEGRRDGGQIYRRQPNGFIRSHEALYGSESGRAALLHAAFDAIRGQIDYRPETLAWNVADGHLHVTAGTQVMSLPFDALIIASGATDRLMPVPGWNMAGVYSLGAAQIAFKSQACAIGRRVVFLGTGPLLYLVASQYVKAGAGVAAVLDTSLASARVKALPKLAARPATVLKGLRLIANLRRNGISIQTGITPLEISGSPDRGVDALTVRTAAGVELKIACDAVALGYHLRPETQLADLARCEFQFQPTTHQWLPVVDADGRTSVKGVYLAGDGTRLFGADGAEEMGRLAALAVLADAGRPVDHGRVRRLRRSLSRMERFRAGLAEAFPWPANSAASLPDNTVICRCEVITAGEIRQTARQMGAVEINRAKAFSRIGMGRCQGRYCSHAAVEVLAAAAAIPVERVGRLRGQAPVKPLPIAVEAVDE
jgi:NADPH-dependent 2,4-dienoyl-CoA reductase/sulfur reductase-like enzyme